MNKIRIALASMLSAVFLVLGGVSAQAYTDYYHCYSKGGRIYHMSRSHTGIRVYASGPSTRGCGYSSLAPGQSSWYNQPSRQDVDAFYVGPDWKCQNVNTRYNYFGNTYGTWFWLQNDSVYISLECTRTITYD